jgi:hypothetical protein
MKKHCANVGKTTMKLNCLFALSVLLMSSCTLSKQFYLWVEASPTDPVGINLQQGQLLVDLSYDGEIHELRIPNASGPLSLPDDFTITFQKGSEPTTALIGMAIDVVDENGCVIACGSLAEVVCCNDTFRLGESDSPLTFRLFPLGVANCEGPATSAGRDCRE